MEDTGDLREVPKNPSFSCELGSKLDGHLNPIRL